jgi:hypothetical protein
VKKAAKIAFGVCLSLTALPVILVAGLVIFGTAKPPPTAFLGHERVYGHGLQWVAHDRALPGA